MPKKIFLTLSEKLGDSNHFIVDNRVGGDDYLYWIKELENKGYEIYFVNWEDYEDSGFKRIYNYSEKKFVEQRKLNNEDSIFLYKQEGFVRPEKVKRFFEMLEGLEKTGAFIINNPKTIRWNISKEHLYYLIEKGISASKAYEIKEIIERVRKGEKFVVKPKIASRGDGLVLINGEKDLEKLESIKNKEDYLAQEFCNEIRKGERSLFFIGDEYSHAVIKTPNPNNPEEIRCNKSTGGIVEKYEPMKEEIEYAKDVMNKISEEYPIIFSRVDFAYHDGKPHLIEAELVNPSAFAIFSKVEEEFAKKFVGYLDKLIIKK